MPSRSCFTKLGANSGFARKQLTLWDELFVAWHLSEGIPAAAIACTNSDIANTDEVKPNDLVVRTANQGGDQSNSGLGSRSSRPLTAVDGGMPPNSTS
jgi:hypothetical protein